MNKTIFGAAVLIAVAIAAVFLFSSKKDAQQPSPTPPPSSNNSQQTARTVEAKKTQDLLNDNPGQNATEAELSAYTGKLAEASVVSATLNIGECKPMPGVLRVKNNTSVTIVNPDAVPHRIYTGQFDITVPAKGEKIYVFKLPSDGIYSYRCDVDLSGIVLQSE